MASEWAAAVAASLAVIVAAVAMVGFLVVLGAARDAQQRMEEREARTRWETRSLRWQIAQEERQRWLREWSLLTSDPAPGEKPPEAKGDPWAGILSSNFVVRRQSSNLSLLPGARNSTPASPPSPSTRRSIGRSPEEMRLTRALESASSPSERSPGENVPSG